MKDELSTHWCSNVLHQYVGSRYLTQCMEFTSLESILLKSKSDSYLLVIMFSVSYALLVYFTIHNLSSLALECSR